VQSGGKKGRWELIGGLLNHCLVQRVDMPRDDLSTCCQSFFFEFLHVITNLDTMPEQVVSFITGFMRGSQAVRYRVYPMPTKSCGLSEESRSKPFPDEDRKHKWIFRKRAEKPSLAERVPFWFVTAVELGTSPPRVPGIIPNTRVMGLYEFKLAQYKMSVTFKKYTGSAQRIIRCSVRQGFAH
jgi:hypothetical protein